MHNELVLVGNHVNSASKCQSAAGPGELVIGDDAAERLSSIYQINMETGPDIRLIRRSSRRHYQSHRFDWRAHARESRGLHLDGLNGDDENDVDLSEA